MRAITVAQPGGPENLRVEERPTPSAGPGEVLIKVVAAGLNRADVMQRMGFYPPPPGASDILGLEVSGIVQHVADDVTGFAAGDLVCALLTGGGYAEYVNVPAVQVLPVPAGVAITEAAGLPEVSATVLSNLMMTAHLSPGETVLIHGGSSGIGTHAIQFAKALGATVAVTAGSDAKLDLCGELGADILINYRTQEFGEVLKDRVDVILDIIGAKYLSHNISALAVDGRLVTIGLQGGVVAEININDLLRKRGTFAATNLRGRPLDQKASIISRVREVTWPLIESGAIKPIVGQAFPLEDAAEAHRFLESADSSGKVLLTI
ncbi:NAD(P)H-quinone oxidoreductase [Jongsikchunia kroppenstedtii]|uniref:NAD(P)H-quinone oxidoreductase n=1 Tax=Jongsikchunia kroppenstedtii TaxID=1121721 RepID=UPI00037173E5|nr:NAD(P)H-quinone oxidoreductase [Jongsikchunia kroppenstedtii]